jgi:conjugative relaxase-like TrwC/TraI family protein
VQSTHKITGDAAQGFAEYLTSTSSRGDYYVGGGGDVEPPQGYWHGSPDTLRGLGIDPEGPVARDDLLALMRGQHPESGEPFRPVGGDGSRVAGIDMTLSAPKSVSALWAVSSPYRRAQLEAAHRKAVASAIARVERDVQLVRRRDRGAGVVRWERAQRLLAAEFVHTASRLTRDQERSGGVPDPQLHSHVVVLAAERLDGRLAAADSRELFRSARANGAWYRAELAANLQELGVNVEGRTGNDGRYFEVEGVPRELSARWSARSEDIAKAARAFRQRYGRAPRAGELGALTVRTRGAKSALAEVDVDRAWRAVGEEYGLGAEHAEGLFELRVRVEKRDLASDLVGDVCRDRALVSERDVYARAFELTAGHSRPELGERAVADLERRGELVRLEGGMWTTRELRELEQRALDTAAGRVEDTTSEVGPWTLRRARAQTEEQLGGELSEEQARALETIAGRGGVSALVGQAGTGKGVVIGAAREAWESDDREVIGTAVAGVTAKRLGADAGIERTMTTDALLRRIDNGQVRLDERSVVVMDEAGMADTRRLARVIEETDRRDAKLVLVGDPAQLSPIGAGGLFSEVTERVPAAELTEIRRAREGWEREAWEQVRAGDSQQALAQYHARDRLHVCDTRHEARERVVEDWDRSRREVGAGRSVIVTDASNRELDQLNALAQERRARAGELGPGRVELPGRPYCLARNDRVLFTGAHYRPGEERVENGTRAEVIAADGRSVTLRTDEPEPRDVKVNTREFSDLRLAYAQHVYKAQGATVERTHALMGGWQTDRERAYVALSRARERTDVYVCREDLGEQGMDAGAIERLGERIAHSNAQQASVTREQAPTPSDESSHDEHGVSRESEVGRILREHRESERSRSEGIEL